MYNHSSVLIVLDRPRRGLIEVNQHSLVDLQKTMRDSAAYGTGQTQ